MAEDKVERIGYHVSEIMKVLDLDLADPKRTERCLHELSEKLVASGQINARSAVECEDPVHQLLMIAIWYIRDGCGPRAQRLTSTKRL